VNEVLVGLEWRGLIGQRAPATHSQRLAWASAGADWLVEHNMQQMPVVKANGCGCESRSLDFVHTELLFTFDITFDHPQF